MNDETIRYYDTHAEEFVAGTENADISACRDRFLQYLKPGQKILDAGCGSGRDVIAFKNEGYEVEAFDASEELCRIAAEKTGIPIKQQRFEELEGVESYDGIWACASILHLPKPELSETIKKIAVALKPGGVLYTSFKYGTFEGMRNGRYFTDFTEDTLKVFWSDFPSLPIITTWLTQDVRTGREEERWINLLARRV